jgi:hypothetical protein
MTHPQGIVKLGIEEKFAYEAARKKFNFST